MPHFSKHLNGRSGNAGCNMLKVQQLERSLARGVLLCTAQLSIETNISLLKAQEPISHHEALSVKRAYRKRATNLCTRAQHALVTTRRHNSTLLHTVQTQKLKINDLQESVRLLKRAKFEADQRAAATSTRERVNKHRAKQKQKFYSKSWRHQHGEHENKCALVTKFQHFLSNEKMRGIRRGSARARYLLACVSKLFYVSYMPVDSFGIQQEVGSELIVVYSL